MTEEELNFKSYESKKLINDIENSLAHNFEVTEN